MARAALLPPMDLHAAGLKAAATVPFTAPAAFGATSSAATVPVVDAVILSFAFVWLLWRPGLMQLPTGHHKPFSFPFPTLPLY